MLILKNNTFLTASRTETLIQPVLQMGINKKSGIPIDQNTACISGKL